MNKRTAKRLKTVPGIVMAAAVFTGIMAAGSISADAKPSVKLDGEYHAALGVRTGSGKNIYRMAYYHKKSAGTDKWKHLAIGDYSSEEYQEIKSTFKDVVIKGNGKYTVSLSNADFQGETSFSRMQVSTDIPDTGKIKFSDMSVKINGRELVKYDEPYIDKHNDADGNCCLLVINEDREGFDSLDGNCVPQGTENKISITFTVSGFNYKKGEKPKPAVTPSPKPTKTPAPEEPEETPEPEETSKASAFPDTSSQQPVVDEEIRPVVIISIIVIAVISVIAITFSVTKRKK
ncbi:MAG: hypothetical protein HFH68_08980 [Lachnospiraceae bacterium]|nr:hypothetical protein [Lachnospiraceae bacterium]